MPTRREAEEAEYDEADLERFEWFVAYPYQAKASDRDLFNAVLKRAHLAGGLEFEVDDLKAQVDRLTAVLTELLDAWVHWRLFGFGQSGKDADKAAFRAKRAREAAKDLLDG